MSENIKNLVSRVLNESIDERIYDMLRKKGFNIFDRYSITKWLVMVGFTDQEATEVYEGYSGYRGKPEITITPSGKNRYDVNYSVNFGDTLIELNGELTPFNDGRHTDYDFEVGWFQDKESEEFYDYNWEMVEYQIKSEF
jgi:hypothetical protein